MSDDGDVSGKKIVFTVNAGDDSKSMFCEIHNSKMQRYEVDISKIDVKINSFKISPNMDECFVKVKALGFV